MAKNNFKLDQMFSDPDVCDQTTLVRANHDQTITDDSRLDWDSVS